MHSTDSLARHLNCSSSSSRRCSSLNSLTPPWKKRKEKFGWFKRRKEKDLNLFSNSPVISFEQLLPTTCAPLRFLWKWNYDSPWWWCSSSLPPSASTPLTAKVRIFKAQSLSVSEIKATPANRVPYKVSTKKSQKKKKKKNTHWQSVWGYHPALLFICAAHLGCHSCTRKRQKRKEKEFFFFFLWNKR